MAALVENVTIPIYICFNIKLISTGGSNFQNQELIKKFHFTNSL